MDRLGLSEVQIVQLVVKGVGKLIEIEKHMETGGNISDKLID